MTSRRDEPAPPRLAERLVQRTVARDGWADVTTGDLREEFVALARARGPRFARLWYWREALQVLVVYAARAASRAVFSLFTLGPHGGRMVRTLLQEGRFAVRSLIRQPLASGVVLLTLALGLGANAATFGMIDALLLRPFPFADVDRLVMLSENSAAEPYPQEAVSPGNFRDIAAAVTTLDAIAAFRWHDVNLAGSDRPERVGGFAVTGHFFSMLRVTPALGRLLDEQDMTYGRHRQVVLSDGLWKRRFGGRADVVGQSVTLDGEPYTVVGVGEPGFDFPNGAELWTAFGLTPEAAGDRADHYLTVIGRLRDGITRDEAAAELETIYARIRSEHVEATRGRQLVVRTLTEGMVDIGMPQILILWQAAAALVLLIGCTNVANLMLARGAARQRELALRLAIGASRWRIIRQLLVESLVVALAASPLALAVAAVALRLCKAGMPAELVRFVPGWTTMGVTGTVTLFTVAAAALTAVLFGILPAIQSSRPALTAALRDGGRSVSIASRSRLRRGLVVAEIALALPLLVASGLSAIGAQRFASGPQGYDPDGVFRARTLLADAVYTDDASRRRFAERLVDAARAQPGVEMAATTSVLPSSGSNQQRVLVIDGRPPDPTHPLTIHFRAVSPGYLELLRIPIRQGRGIAASDREDAMPVAVITQAAADRYWPGESPIGRRIRLGGADRPSTTIVGVSGDTIDDWFNRRRAPTVYVPVAQAPGRSVSLVLRTSGDPGALLDSARAAVAAVDPSQPVFEAMTMRDALRIRTTGLRFIGALMAVFGILALVLAAIGIYSVMAFHVAQRRHEMGIRMALGATGRDVLRLTLGHSAKMSGLGIAIGLAGGIALARVLESALFGVVALEPWLFGAIAGALAIVALVASLIPARHAATADPIRALRAD